MKTDEIKLGLTRFLWLFYFSVALLLLVSNTIVGAQTVTDISPNNIPLVFSAPLFPGEPLNSPDEVELEVNYDFALADPLKTYGLWGRLDSIPEWLEVTVSVSSDSLSVCGSDVGSVTLGVVDSLILEDIDQHCVEATPPLLPDVELMLQFGIDWELFGEEDDFAPFQLVLEIKES